MEQFERITVLDPAYDKRNPDPKKNYGVHGVELRMVLKGEKGAVQFVVFTNWHLPHVQRETDMRILAKASRGSTFDPHISENMAKDMKEVNEGIESAKRMIGLSRSPQLDPLDLECFYHPQPADVGFHSPKPMYEGDKPVTNSCEFLNGKPCYYDGSGLQAKKVFDILLKEGSEGVWKYLEGYYNDTFIEEDAPST